MEATAIDNLSPEDLQEAGRRARIEMAKREFVHFVPFVQIIEPGTGMVPLQEWPHLQQAHTTLSNSRLVIWAKSRQIGITTTLAAYVLHHASFTPNALALVFSKGERDAWEFLSKSRATHEALPLELRETLAQPDNREQMTFKSGSRIITQPSTESAGRGLNPTLVVIDEADFHEYLDACYNSVKPGLDDNNGQLIITSTVSPYHMGSLFQQLYQSAPRNGFSKLFFGWRSRPHRTQEWYDERKLQYPDQALFQKEHPDSEEEAFAPARALAAFDLEVLIRMKQDIKEPVETPTMGNGVQVNIYQPFQPGKRYAAGTDTSHGTGHDYAVTVIVDTVTGYVAADICSQVLNPSELAVASVELLNQYGSPIWGIEDNDWGILTITMAQELRYRRIYFRGDSQPGWHTYDTAGSSHGSRYVLWGDLIEAVHSRAITVPNSAGLAQFFTVIRNPEKRGRVEAQSGTHDDYPMAVGIAWQLRQLARPAASDRGRDPNRMRRGRRSWASRWS